MRERLFSTVLGDTKSAAATSLFDEPLVLVGLSSTWMDQVPVLQRIAEALGRLPVRGVITTGPAIEPAALTAPDNVSVVRAAPHGEVLKHAAAVVTHGGHGTVAKSLAAGVPLACMPLGRDQPDVAARVVRAGAGLRVDAGADVGAIADATCRLLREPSYTEAARALATAIAAERREDRAVEELESLARERMTPRGSTIAPWSRKQRSKQQRPGSRPPARDGSC